MKYLKKFENFTTTSDAATPPATSASPVKPVDHSTIWEVDWKTIVPDEITVIKGGLTDINGYILDDKGNPTNEPMRFKLGNLMSDPVYQITYERDFEAQGIPDTLELDVTILDKNGVFTMNFEITFGNLIAVGFNITPVRHVNVYQNTTYRSKMDSSNTVFAFDEPSIQKVLKFINRFDGIKLLREDLNFLDAVDNWQSD